MKKVGRKTELTDELVRKIKQSILDGNDLKTTAKIYQIPESTLYCWTSDNYLNLADKIEGWRRDRKLNLAEGVIEEMLTMPVTVLKHVNDEEEKDYIVTEPALVKIKQDTAKFVAETLGKNSYAKRNELTGANGKELVPVSEEIKNKVNASIDEYLKGHSK